MLCKKSERTLGVIMHQNVKTDGKCPKSQTEQRQGVIRRKISTQVL